MLCSDSSSDLRHRDAEPVRAPEPDVSALSDDESDAAQPAFQRVSTPNASARQKSRICIMPGLLGGCTLRDMAGRRPPSKLLNRAGTIVPGLWFPARRLSVYGDALAQGIRRCNCSPPTRPKAIAGGRCLRGGHFGTILRRRRARPAQCVSHGCQADRKRACNTAPAAS